MSDFKWRILFISQILLILIIGVGVTFRMGFFEDIRETVVHDANAETLDYLDKKLEEIKKSSELKNIDVSNKTELEKNDSNSEKNNELIESKKESGRVFLKKTDQEVDDIISKYEDKIKKIYDSVVVTSYNSEVGQTDDTPCIAAKGTDLCKRNMEDIVANNDLPIHTKILIPEYFGDQIFYVEDRMNARYTGTMRTDIWMKKKIDSRSWGAKTTKIIVLE